MRRSQLEWGWEERALPIFGEQPHAKVACARRVAQFRPERSHRSEANKVPARAKRMHTRTISVRLPEPLVAELDAEARERGISRSALVRERLERAATQARLDPLASIRDLIGSVDGGLPDLSARKKHYLHARISGRKHTPR